MRVISRLVPENTWQQFRTIDIMIVIHCFQKYPTTSDRNCKKIHENSRMWVKNDTNGIQQQFQNNCQTQALKENDFLLYLSLYLSNPRYFQQNPRIALVNLLKPPISFCQHAQERH